jgi:hypothetical protein
LVSFSEWGLQIGRKPELESYGEEQQIAIQEERGCNDGRCKDTVASGILEERELEK